MTDRQTALAYDGPSPKLLHSAFFVEQVSLGLTAQIAAIALCGWIFPGVSLILPAVLLHMNAPQAVSAFLCACSFMLSEPERSRKFRLIAWFYAGLTLLISTVTIGAILRASAGLSLHGFSLDAFIAMSPGAPIRVALVLACIAILSVLSRKTQSIFIRFTDLLKMAVLLLVADLTWEALLSVTDSVTGAHAEPVALETLVCLILLSTAAVLRDSEYSIFRAYLGSSIGSRLARWLLPVLIGLQLFREILRSHLLNTIPVSRFYLLPVLTTTASFVIFILVLFIIRRINSMEITIRDLTLRDGLTGLYNVKGFQRFGENALASARRAQLPFAVVFIDLDRLKEINDNLGHHIGSAALAETARLLANTFRENDVVGRVGGDEFAIAGQFDEISISAIVERLRKITASRNPELKRLFPLSFSIGFAVSSGGNNESFRELLTRADKAMYEIKHSNRRARA